ncbi:MAG: hypothetical protein ABI992_13920, partial [Chthoniobacterales bacterium]
MLQRAFAFFVVLLTTTFFLRAQDATHDGLPELRDANGSQMPLPHSAWLDLRQAAAGSSTPQNAPDWVESITLVSIPAKGETPAQTIFRIRVARPQLALQVLLMRLLFDDKPDQQPTITIWDESGSQVMQSAPLGSGIDLASSESVLLPMIGVSAIDVQVKGDGSTIRGAFLDWMVTRSVAHPISAGAREIMPEPFAAAAPLRVPEKDSETFGTVTASLAPEAIRIGATVP